MTLREKWQVRNVFVLNAMSFVSGVFYVYTGIILDLRTVHLKKVKLLEYDFFSLFGYILIWINL